MQAALGENLIVLVNYAWSAVLYVRFLRGEEAFAAMEKWQTDYLPVYAGGGGSGGRGVSGGVRLRVKAATLTHGRINCPPEPANPSTPMLCGCV